MLVLSRKCDESIMIGDAICVVVGKVGGGRVKLKISAPERVTIVRGELETHKDRTTESLRRASLDTCTGTYRSEEIPKSAPGGEVVAYRREKLKMLHTIRREGGK